MPRAPHMTANEVLRALRADGWIEDTQRGSHRQFAHPVKPGKVTVAMHGTRTLPPKTLASIAVQAGLSVDELRALS